MKKHYFNYFNRSDAVFNGYWHVCKAVMLTEIVLLVISIFYSMLAIKMILKSMQNKRNMRNIWTLCTVLYLISALGRGVQAGIILSGDEHTDPYLTLALICTSYVRAFFLYTALFCLPFFVVERCYATCYLEQYEKEQQIKLGNILVLLLLASAAASSYAAGTGNSTVIHLVVVVFANSFAFVVNAVHYKLNKRYYWEAKSGLDGIRKYSLGARYQIAENLRICHFVNHLVFCAVLLNIILSICLAISKFKVSEFYQNVAVLIYNYTALVYGIVIPLVIYCHNKKHKTELERLKMKVLAENRQGSSGGKSSRDRETRKSHHVDMYSDMFMI